MHMGKFLSIVGLFVTLYGEVRVYRNPQQYFNNTQNYANRIVYFFIEKTNDGSVCLQIQPPPFYPSDQKFLSQGIAYIDCPKVVQNYTPEQVATLGVVDITFSVEAYPNIRIPTGYALFGQLFEWNIFLDPRSLDFYSLQLSNLSGGNSLQVLKIEQYNPDDKFLVIYSKLEEMNFWASGNQGVFISDRLTDNVLFKQTTPKTPTTVDLTLSVDLSRIPIVAEGVYTMYFQFQMAAIEPSTTFLTVLTDLSKIQVIQINYLENSILSINAYFDSKNTLYTPDPTEQAILRKNKTFLYDQYTAILEAMQIQWDGYAATAPLTPAEFTLIKQMQAFISVSLSSVEKFQLNL
jgi:hypothetical protein